MEELGFSFKELLQEIVEIIDQYCLILAPNASVKDKGKILII